MKKLFMISCAFCLLSTAAEARVDVSLGFGVPAATYVEPAPAYYEPEPAPAYVVAPDYGYYNGHRHYDRHWHDRRGRNWHR